MNDEFENDGIRNSETGQSSPSDYSGQTDTTYHRDYSSNPDPNARTYVNENSGTGYSTSADMNQNQNAGSQASGQGRPYVSYDPNGSGSYNPGGGYYGNYTAPQGPAPRSKKPKKARTHKAHPTWKFIGKAAAFGLIAGVIIVGCLFGYDKISGGRTTASKSGSPGTVTTTSSSTSSDSKSGVTTVAKNAMPSIVSITSTFQAQSNSNYNDFFYWFYGGNDSGSTEQTGSGSGVIIGETDSQLMIVTNNHVISDDSYGDAKKVTVTFSDDTTVDASVKGTDPDADLAVLTVKKSDLKSGTLDKIKIAVLGDSNKLEVGDEVVAIGNALGYGQSVTTGIISAKDREVQLQDKTMTLLQTDAAINPGNSGGALLDMNGNLIGINSAKFASSEVEGMGYAIPISTAKPIIEELMNEEEVKKGEEAYLGIYGTNVTNDLASTYDMPEGVLVTKLVDNSPASEAGIHQRDIITKFNNHSITSMEGLQQQIAKKKAGTEVTITVKRQNSNGDYEDKEIKVKLGKKSQADFSTEEGNGSNSQNNQNSQNDQNDQNSQNGQDSQNDGNSQNQQGSSDSSDIFDYFFGN